MKASTMSSSKIACSTGGLALHRTQLRSSVVARMGAAPTTVAPRMFEVSDAERLVVPDDVAPLFQPLQLGSCSLTNRVVLAPLTRCRCLNGLPPPMTAEYYSQRTTKGSLLITEATVIEPRAYGYPNVPGIHTPEQVKAWQAVTQAVKAKGGVIFCQLWHVGRVSHQDFQPGEAAPISSSAVAIGPEYQVMSPKDWSMKPYPTPRALETQEVKELVELYRQAARNAIDAGFDGVEIHGANGYLVDQFIKDNVNKRTDMYGGSIENRSRFALEVVQAASEEVGAGRVGIRLSPFTGYNDVSSTNPYAQHIYLVEQLSKMGIAYVHMVEPRMVGMDATDEDPNKSLLPFRTAFRGNFLTAGGFDRESGIKAVGSGAADLVAYGRQFIANPDLPKRLLLNAPLNKYNRDTFYAGGAEGYTDYPFL